MKAILATLICLFPLLLTSQNYQAIDAYAKSIDLTTDYKQAAKELTEPYKDESSKARAIFSWLAYHLEYDKRQLRKITKKMSKGPQKINASSEAEAKKMLLEKERAAMERALKKKKGVCQDYAWLFTAMLEEVGIEAEFVVGHGRTEPSARYSSELGHAWNAAKIDGEWALFDVTWSKDMWEAGGDGFFMMSPQAFLRSHFPEDEAWQLIPDPIDMKAWIKQMFWYKGYERYGEASVMAGTDTITLSTFPIDSTFRIDLILPPGKTLYAVKNQGQKSKELTKQGNSYLMDFKAKKFRGTTTIAVSDGQKLWPLLDVKVR